MKKRIFSLLAAVCLFLLPLLPVSAERQFEDCIANCQLYDPDVLFSEMEQEELSRLIRETSDKIDMYIAVQIINSGDEMNDFETEAFADDRYDELFNPQSGTDTDGLMLVLNMPTHYPYITTSGIGEMYYYNANSDNRINLMISHLIGYLRNNDNAGAVRQFCEDAVYYYNQGVPRNARTYSYNTRLYSYVKNGKLVRSKTLPLSYRLNYGVGLIAGAICAVLTGLISFAVIKSRYKFTKSLSASNYISDRDTTFYQRDDMFIRTHTTKTRIDTNRGGGGGGGGGFGGGSSHSSFGGHSHGGGGGHW